MVGQFILILILPPPFIASFTVVVAMVVVSDRTAATYITRVLDRWGGRRTIVAVFPLL